MPDVAATPFVCPFTVTVDTREQSSYSFLGLTHGSGSRKRPLIVPTMRTTLTTGDYSIFGYPSICIERKSKADLFGSVVKRANFVGRLERMSELAYAAVVVEAEWSEILQHPPPFTRYPPKSLARTIMAWSVRFNTVHWWFMPGREVAEALTFRLLQRFHTDRTVDQS